MTKTIKQANVYVYECPLCGRKFTRLTEIGTLFCDCDGEDMDKDIVTIMKKKTEEIIQLLFKIDNELSNIDRPDIEEKRKVVQEKIRELQIKRGELKEGKID